VHLGADLVQHAAPWTAERLDRVPEIDHKLAGLLDHYRAHAEPGRPWKLVLAGDFVDFIGMSIAPRPETDLGRPLTEDEKVFGLGSARDRAGLKMRRVAERHDLVFRKLAEFIDAGHSLVVIRGNHDVEFYFPDAREAFVEALRARRAPDAMHSDEDFEGHVEFRAWLYYVENVLYVEHGHQYDENCAHPHVLAPLSPEDPRHIDYSFADILLRYIVRPTRGLGTEGHEDRAMIDYLRLFARLGIIGGPLMAYRFFRSIVRLFRKWRAHAGARARGIREAHERRLHQVADRFRLNVDTLRAIGSLSATPITTRALMIMRGVFLDGMLAIVASVLLVSGLSASDGVHAALIVPVALLSGLGIYLWMKSVRVFDPNESLLKGARHIAEKLPARYVVMGHTHIPRIERVAEGTDYVNIGMWSTDELDDDVVPAPCSHLVIRTGEGEPAATLYSWDLGEGAKPMFDFSVSGVHPKLPASLPVPTPAEHVATGAESESRSAVSGAAEEVAEEADPASRSAG